MADDVLGECSSDDDPSGVVRLPYLQVYHVIFDLRDILADQGDFGNVDESLAFAVFPENTPQGFFKVLLLLLFGVLERFRYLLGGFGNLFGGIGGVPCNEFRYFCGGHFCLAGYYVLLVLEVRHWDLLEPPPRLLRGVVELVEHEADHVTRARGISPHVTAGRAGGDEVLAAFELVEH